MHTFSSDMTADPLLSSAYMKASKAYLEAADALEVAAQRLEELSWVQAARAARASAQRAKMHAVNRERHAKSWGYSSLFPAPSHCPRCQGSGVEPGTQNTEQCGSCYGSGRYDQYA
jgi:hypothetical protein